MTERVITVKAVSIIVAVILLLAGFIPTGIGFGIDLYNSAYAEEIEADDEMYDTGVADESEIIGDEETAAEEPDLLFEEIEEMMAPEEEVSEWFDSVSGGTSPYSVNTSWLHYRSDGVVSFSRQMNLSNPDGTPANYTINDWEPGEEKRLRALFANADRVAAQYGITGDNKRALIQTVIWAVLSDMVPSNPPISSIGASTFELSFAAQSLYNEAYWGWRPGTGSVEGFDDDGLIRFSASSDGKYARFGPFTIHGASSASIKAIDAPAGSYFGSLFGSPIDPGNLVNEAQFYLFIPRTCDTLVAPKVTFSMDYDGFTVTKYSGLNGYKDQFVFEPAGSVQIKKNGTCIGFGEVEILKVDEYSWESLEGAEFIIEEWNEEAGEWIKSKAAIWWDNIKKRYFTGLLSGMTDPFHRYRIREVKAPYSYLATWSYEVSFTNKYGMYYKVNAVNTPVTLTINVSKVDRDSEGSVAQGNATLEGAVYGLFMNEDRDHPDGTVFTKDQKIAEAATNKDGKIVFGDLFPAKYYVKELSPSAGYLLDDTIYEIDGTHDGVSGTIVRDIMVTEQVKKQMFEIVKMGIHKLKPHAPLKGAGFSVYLISDLADVKDGTLFPAGLDWAAEDFKDYDFADETTAEVDGISTPEFFTDSSGRLVSPELPFGEYVVVETTVPVGYIVAESFVVIVDEDSREAQPVRTIKDKEIYTDPPNMGVPKTGDDFNILLIVIILLVSVLVASVVIGNVIKKKITKD